MDVTGLEPRDIGPEAAATKGSDKLRYRFATAANFSTRRPEDGVLIRSRAVTIRVNPLGIAGTPAAKSFYRRFGERVGRFPNSGERPTTVRGAWSRGGSEIPSKISLAGHSPAE